MSKIFISYRRADAGYQPEIIKNTLSKYIDDDIIFYDHDIEKGDDFLQIINDRLESAQVMLILIGKDWLDIIKERSKLAGVTDFVKLEIERGLEKDTLDSHFTIIPILFEGAQMPSQDDLPVSIRNLARINALTIHQNELLPKLNELGADLCRKLNGRNYCLFKKFKFHLLAGLAIIVGGYFGSQIMINKPGCDPFSADGDLNIMLAASNEDIKDAISAQIINGLKPFEVSLKNLDGKIDHSDPDHLKGLAAGCGAGIFVNCGSNSFQFDVLDSILRSYIEKQYLIEPSKIDAAYADLGKMTCLIKSVLLERKHNYTGGYSNLCFEISVANTEVIQKTDTIGMILAQSAANVYEKQGKLDSAMVILQKLSITGGLNPDSIYTRMSRIAAKTENTSAEIIAKTGLIKQAEKNSDVEKQEQLKKEIKVLNVKLNKEQSKVEKPVDQSTMPGISAGSAASTPAPPRTNTVRPNTVAPTSVTGHPSASVPNINSNILVGSTQVPVVTQNVKFYENLNRLISNGNFQEIQRVYDVHKDKIDGDPALLSLYYESLYKAKEISEIKIPKELLNINTRFRTKVITDKIKKGN
ncbi:MAG: toll/interleukin-1 receptor domain-containing protein [Saprospiraceae bacterium]